MKTILRYAFLSMMVWTVSSSGLYASEDEVVVRLSTEKSLLPTYIEPIQGSSFSKEYITQLQKVIAFDINYNGIQRIVGASEQQKIASVLKDVAFDQPIPLETIRSVDVAYILRLSLNDKKLSAKLINVPAASERSIGPLACSGDLAKDRRVIHQLADSIHVLVCGKPGIASTSILYVHKQKKGTNTTSEVYVADYDGCNSRQCTDTRSLCATPIWIPPRAHGSQQARISKSASFIYVSFQLGQPKLYATSLIEGKQYRLTTMKGNQLTPAVSSQGQLAFCSDCTGTADLYLLAYEPGVGSIGKPRQLFHAKGSATASPTFSPDGSKIAFVSNKDGSAKIYVMDVPAMGAQPGKPTLISVRCQEGTAPSWSPDGKKIAYSGRNGSERQIWIYDVEHKTERQLTTTAGNKESPSWAPNSAHVLFHCYQGSTCELYFAHPNIPTPVKITSGAGEKLFAQWEPPSVEGK